MTKQFWAIIAIIVVIFGGILIFHGNNNNTGNSGTPTNHVEGSASTGVTLVEYGDYECPYCGEYFSTVQQVAAAYNQEIQFQFRNLPLAQIHPNAFAGARAAEAAGLQGKFWQMHDLLYENQNEWSESTGNVEPTLVSYAKSLGLNTAQFQSDFSSQKVDNLINADIAAFNKTGQEEATPTFFLDGKKISPDNTVASFETLINAEILKKTGKPSSVAAASTSSTGTGATSGQSKQ
ncbi:MAG TPA: thioredoxin domain-containing protein [Candidatus Saccharimonadales bacterium]